MIFRMVKKKNKRAFCKKRQLITNILVNHFISDGI